MIWALFKNKLWKDKEEKSRLAFDSLLLNVPKYIDQSLIENFNQSLVISQLFLLKLMDANYQCRVCLQPTQTNNRIQLKCQHTFCSTCVKKYIETLRNYHLLTPEKLCCLQEGCQQQIIDSVITKLFPGQQGFIYNIIKKRYRESKDPNIIIFDCKGYITQDRKNLIPKTSNLLKQQHAKLTNQLAQKIISGQQQNQLAKTCKNIISFNKSVPRKETFTQCVVCSCTYCISCFNFAHQASCPQRNPADLAIINKGKNQKGNQGSRDELDNFVARNGILRCLNEKCRVLIAKEEGCFWIKCRCSWQMCYPCKKIWGNCQHFKNYPYKKFIPPPQWMVKALNLF